MRHSTYRALPVEALYQLLEKAIREMILAYDHNKDGLIEFKALKKQVEIILEIIDERKKNEVKKN